MIEINGRKIGEGHPVYIIAEIGINYNGEVDLALEMIKTAAAIGVDAVKLQIITAERSYAKTSESYKIFKQIELRKDDWQTIVSYARKLNLHCFATFVNSDDLEEYLDLSWPAFKISSTNLTNFPLLEKIAAQKKPVILSTGASYLAEIEEAVQFLRQRGQKQIAILQCTAVYPTTMEDVHLLTIKTLTNHFPESPLGFSDHTQGTHCAIIAVALGAKIIEKHLTLDKTMPGPDHYFSASPEEMKAMVEAIRCTEHALGSSEKKPTDSEMMTRDQLRRSLVVLTPMKEGDVLTREKIGIKRSGVKGLEPKYLDAVLGKKIVTALQADDPLTLDVLEVQG